MRPPIERSSAAGDSSLLDDVDYRLARTPAEKEAIYNLRYRAYLREGAVKESPEQRIADKYDDLPNSWTFGVYLRGDLCSSVRISVLTPEWRQSSSAEAFGEILHPRLDRGEVIIDPARFVVDPDRAKRYPELPYVMLRLAYLACEYFNASLGLAIVRAEHQAFYRRVFLHETIAEPRFFPGLLKPVGLMAADFPAKRAKVFERYPMMRSSAFERRSLFERRSPDYLPGKFDRGHDELDFAPQLEGEGMREVILHHQRSSVPFVGGEAVVEREITRRGVPISTYESVSERRKETTEIIHRIAQWAGNEEAARLWFRSEGIPALGDRTAEALVNEGKSALVREYLDHVALGSFA